MKTHVANPRRLASLATAAILALLAPALNAFSQANSPVGTWDCVMTGSGQNGILLLNFMGETDRNNGLPVFEGIFIQAGHLKNSGSGRGTTTGSGRAGSSGSFTNLFGGGLINGSANGLATNVPPNDWYSDSRGYRGYWAYNSKGQTVGQFYTVLNATANITNFFETCIDEIVQIPLTNGGTFNLGVNFCFTNAVLATNVAWGPAGDGEVGFTNLTFTNINFTVGTVGQTNDISFVGKVIPNKRLTLVGTSAFGKFTIRGVPLQPAPVKLPVDGFTWTGTKVQNGFKSQEEFNLISLGVGVGPTNIFQPIANAYVMSGQGPSYVYGTSNDSSFCLISSQKKIAFFVQQVPFGTSPDRVETRSTFGQLINTTKKIGSQSVGESTADENLIQFNAYLTPFPIP